MSIEISLNKQRSKLAVNQLLHYLDSIDTPYTIEVQARYHPDVYYTSNFNSPSEHQFNYLLELKDTNIPSIIEDEIKDILKSVTGILPELSGIILDYAYNNNPLSITSNSSGNVVITKKPNIPLRDDMVLYTHRELDHRRTYASRITHYILHHRRSKRLVAIMAFTL